MEVDVDVSVSFNVSVIKNNRALMCAPLLLRPARPPAPRERLPGVRAPCCAGRRRARAAAGLTARATALTWRSSTSAWWTRRCCTTRRRATPTPTRARRAPRPSPATRQPGQQHSAAWAPGRTASRMAPGLQGPPASLSCARWPGPEAAVSSAVNVAAAGAAAAVCLVAGAQRCSLWGAPGTTRCRPQHNAPAVRSSRPVVAWTIAG